jgi:hypothetical protein
MGCGGSLGPKKARRARLLGEDAPICLKIGRPKACNPAAIL